MRVNRACWCCPLRNWGKWVRTVHAPSQPHHTHSKLPFFWGHFAEKCFYFCDPEHDSHFVASSIPQVNLHGLPSSLIPHIPRLSDFFYDSFFSLPILCIKLETALDKLIMHNLSMLSFPCSIFFSLVGPKIF